MFALFAFTACENEVSTQTAKAEIQETTNRVETAFNKESAALKVKIEKAKEEVDEEIKALKIKWSTASDEAKTKLERELDELEYHQSKLANDLKHIGDKVEDGWDKFKVNAKETLQKVDDDLEELNKSM